MDLKSTFNSYKKVTQITHFADGSKLTYNNLDPKTIKEGKFTKVWCEKGYWVSFNPERINCFETHPEIETPSI